MISKLFIRGCVFLLMLYLLVGCTYFGRSEAKKERKDIEWVNWQIQKTGCKEVEIYNKTCPTFTLSALSFKQYEGLNTLIEQHLLSLSGEHVEKTLWGYQKAYLKEAKLGDHLLMTVTKLAESNALVVLELKVRKSSFSKYSPSRSQYINFDKRKRGQLLLNSVLAPEKQKDFNAVVYASYQRWLEANQLLNNKRFQTDWPFLMTDNIALLDKSLLLKYQADTLAPYAMGVPKLEIPYDKLEGIIKPKYLP